MNRLAVIFPGLGYHKDKPLLYYAAKLAKNAGYEICCISYHDMPEKAFGDADMIRNAGELVCQQAKEQLTRYDLHVYDDILLIGKSIGTVGAARIAEANPANSRQIWYTPLQLTFPENGSPAAPCIAFLGTSDPWSDLRIMTKTADAQKIPLHLFPECNHSLECGNPLRDLETLKTVMQLTDAFIRRKDI